MTHKKTIIVVNEDKSAFIAAASARQHNEEARIIMIVGQQNDDEKHQSEQFGRLFNVEIREDSFLYSIDVDDRLLYLDAKRTKRLPYDALIFVSGVKKKSLTVVEQGLPKRSLEDAQTAVVVGAGFDGIEEALRIRARGLDVTIIEKNRRIMPRFSLLSAQAMLEGLHDAGIKILLGETIRSVDCQNLKLTLRLESGREIDTDIIVPSIGVSPNVKLIEQAGALIDLDGLIRVDDEMMTTLPSIFACGTAVSVPLVVSGTRIWLPKTSIVRRLAEIAGQNAAAPEGSALERMKPASAPLFLRIGDKEFARVGLSEHEARMYLGDDNFLTTTTVEPKGDDSSVSISLLLDRSKRRIVGGEVFGKIGVTRINDLLAMAVTNGLSPEQIVDVDFSFGRDNDFYDPLRDAAYLAKHSCHNQSDAMTAQTLALWLKNERRFRLVDVDHFPNLAGYFGKKTIHLPLEAIRSRMHELKIDDSPIVLYSQSGKRCFLAQRALAQRGLANVYHLDGGLLSLHLLVGKDGHE